ncbi:MAG TPA: phosphate acyltransferase PlsX [Syntrophomonadaceae bacterium]|nr:phosphate acyltransferase PlsX [Syntrophomonadaceae bacterium]
MRIAVDVMGSDHGPEELIAGALRWCRETGETVSLVGDGEIIAAQLKQQDYNQELVEVIPALQVIDMHESPALALRKKPDASIVVASQLVREGRADALISAGSTGAQMAAAIFILGRMEGVERSPIIAQLPNVHGHFSLLADVGANVDCRPKQLLQFAVLGKTYASLRLGIKEPRIALLNIGEEESKGNSVSIETYELLKKQSHLNFVGNIEGRDLLFGKSDVIVCDGFVGNIVLKTLEGTAMFVAGGVKAAYGSLPEFFNQLDYTKIGGAPLLGVNGISIVCHGSSKRDAVYAGMFSAQTCIQADMVKMQRLELDKSRV